MEPRLLRLGLTMALLVTIALASCQSGSGTSGSSGTSGGTTIGSTGGSSSSTNGAATGRSIGTSTGTRATSSGGVSTGAGSSTGAGLMGSVITIAGGGGIYCPGVNGLPAADGVATASSGPVYVLGGGIVAVDPGTGSLSIVIPSLTPLAITAVALDATGTLVLATVDPSPDNQQYFGQLYSLKGSGVNSRVDAGVNICGDSDSDGGAGLGIIAGMAFDPAGDVFVVSEASGSNCTRIAKVAPDGTVTTLAGGHGPAGFRNGKGSQALFDAPAGIAVDHAGNVYVADTGNNIIREIAPDGTTSTFAGSGNPFFFDGYEAAFNGPTGMAIDENGNLYVADRGNASVRKITPAGKTITLAGNGRAGYVDGTLGMTGTTEFNNPVGVAVDAVGRVYVADQVNCALRMITITDGGFSGTTGGGSTSGGTGGADGGDAGCDPEIANGQFSQCEAGSSFSCACGYHCVFDSATLGLPFDFLAGGAGQVCELPCLTSADCPLSMTGCIAGVCAVVLCGGASGNGAYNSTCSMGDDQADGTCTTLADSSDGGVIAVCLQGGTVPVGGTCGPNQPFFNEPAAVSARAFPGEFCQPGDFCLEDAGILIPRCAQQCDAAAILCPAGQTCLLGSIAGGGVCLPFLDGGG